jgi:hypothetical protein
MKALSTFWLVLALVSKNLIPYSLASSVPRSLVTACERRHSGPSGVRRDTVSPIQQRQALPPTTLRVHYPTHPQTPTPPHMHTCMPATRTRLSSMSHLLPMRILLTPSLACS